MVSSSVSVYGSIVRCAGSAGIRPLADPATENYRFANERRVTRIRGYACGRRSSDEAFASMM
jgi:hypothetical protein